MPPLHELIVDALLNIPSKRRRQIEVAEGHAPAVWLAMALHNGHVTPSGVTESGRAILSTLAAALDLEDNQ